MEEIEITIKSRISAGLNRPVMVSIVVGTLLVICFGIGLTRMGNWLVVEDPLERAQAIVVLSGQVPFRAMQAAIIYEAGWAPEVWITRVLRPAKDSALAQLGISIPGEEVYSRQVLERLGVPGNSIKTLNKRVQNTLDEVEVVAQEIKRIHGERVILVTSKVHTRRVRSTWNAVVGSLPQAVVRYTLSDPSKPDQWWRQTRDAFSVAKEILGLINLWAGFPVRTERS